MCNSHTPHGYVEKWTSLGPITHRNVTLQCLHEGAVQLVTGRGVFFLLRSLQDECIRASSCNVCSEGLVQLVIGGGRSDKVAVVCRKTEVLVGEWHVLLCLCITLPSQQAVTEVKILQSRLNDIAGHSSFGLGGSHTSAYVKPSCTHRTTFRYLRFRCPIQQALVHHSS